MGKICKLVALLIPVAIAWVYYQLTKIEPVPLVEDEFWGPTSEKGKKDDISIRPFKINVPSTVLEDLKARLKTELSSNRLVPPLEGIGFEYGMNSNFLKKVGDYWLNKYDWKAREKLLNKFPQFKTKIGGLDVHFYHVKPTAKNEVQTRPLLMLHGWPGSVVEFQKIIPMLTDPNNSKYNYELIIPSLPGYGFSDRAARPGMGTVQMANIFKRLMEMLGHKKFYVTAGDMGGAITSDIATIYPDRILAAHSQMCMALDGFGHIKFMLVSVFPSVFTTPDVAKHMVGYGEAWSFMMRENGYSYIQGTKPDTVGTALTHSPIGLAAYILEKFSVWTNRSWINREDGGILEKFTMDELLDNLMIYWITGSITTSQRLYAEVLDPGKKHNLEKVPTDVPYACLFMPQDLMLLPKFVNQHKFTNIKRFTVASKGGHFGSFEEPEIVAKDLLSFFETQQ